MIDEKYKRVLFVLAFSTATAGGATNRKLQNTMWWYNKTDLGRNQLLCTSLYTPNQVFFRYTCLILGKTFSH